MDKIPLLHGFFSAVMLHAPWFGFFYREEYNGVGMKK